MGQNQAKWDKIFNLCTKKPSFYTTTPSCLLQGASNGKTIEQLINGNIKETIPHPAEIRWLQNDHPSPEAEVAAMYEVLIDFNSCEKNTLFRETVKLFGLSAVTAKARKFLEYGFSALQKSGRI